VGSALSRDRAVTLGNGGPPLGVETYLWYHSRGQVKINGFFTSQPVDLIGTRDTFTLQNLVAKATIIALSTISS
jgi:hypothetical protein